MKYVKIYYDKKENYYIKYDLKNKTFYSFKISEKDQSVIYIIDFVLIFLVLGFKNFLEIKINLLSLIALVIFMTLLGIYLIKLNTKREEKNKIKIINRKEIELLRKQTTIQYYAEIFCFVLGCLALVFGFLLMFSTFYIFSAIFASLGIIVTYYELFEVNLLRKHSIVKNH